RSATFDKVGPRLAVRRNIRFGVHLRRFRDAGHMSAFSIATGELTSGVGSEGPISGHPGQCLDRASSFMGLAASRKCSMKSFTTGLGARCFRVRIARDGGLVPKSTGNAFTDQRFAL